MAAKMHPIRPTGPALGAERPGPGPTHPHPPQEGPAGVSTCCSYPARGESALLASCSSGAASDRAEMAMLAVNSSLPAPAMNSPAVDLWAARPRLAAVESDLVLIGKPEAIRAADENLLDLSIATKG